MPENQDVLKERLQQLLSQKKSRKYYASRLGVSESEVRELMDRIRRGESALEALPEISNYVSDLEDFITKMEEDVQKGVAEVSARVKDEIENLEQLIEKCKIDTDKWTIDRYVQNWWGNGDYPHWQVKAYLSRKTPADNFQKNFIEFLKNYSPTITPTEHFLDYSPFEKTKACLIINKQDEHINKFDINGNNDLNKRFDTTYNKIHAILKQAYISNEVDEIVYILGSDQFNSEWTGSTVRGTPMENMMPYHEGFNAVCDYEIRTIELLREYTDNLSVIYVSGNHDEYVGWHLINWLRAFYKDKSEITFDISPRYRKYKLYGTSAIMFNHGDAIKPPKLASLFPIEFRKEWSQADNFYIFTGDKHHEVSLDFTGIKFYQLPALSGSKSSWDDKQGHTCSRAELTAFLIDQERGMTNIYKQPL